MTYKVSDRAKEWTTYAGLLVGGIAAVVPQLIPPETWVHYWADAQILLGAAMVFMPQTAGAMAVENEALPLLQALAKHIPPQYAAAMQPFITILARAAVQSTPEAAVPAPAPVPAPVPAVLVPQPPAGPVIQQPIPGPVPLPPGQALTL